MPNLLIFLCFVADGKKKKVDHTLFPTSGNTSLCASIYLRVNYNKRAQLERTKGQGRPINLRDMSQCTGLPNVVRDRKRKRKPDNISEMIEHEDPSHSTGVNDSSSHYSKRKNQSLPQKTSNDWDLSEYSDMIGGYLASETAPGPHDLQPAKLHKTGTSNRSFNPFKVV